MKARVDSGEFSRAIKAAARYTKTTGLEISECVLLDVEGNFLYVRTTTGNQDCIAGTNAFKPLEEGQIVTLASVLVPTVYDSGGFMDIYVDGPRLILEYEDTEFKLGVTDHTEDDFPVWIDAEPLANLDKSILRAACANTTPFDRTGHPIKSSVHLYPTNGGIAVFGTDGYVGFFTNIEGSIEETVSIEAEQLGKALSSTGDIITVGVKDSRIVIDGPPVKISFSSVVCPAVDDIAAGFWMSASVPLPVTPEELYHIANLCDRAASVDHTAEIGIMGNEIVIAGWNVNITSSVSSKIMTIPSIFRCNILSRCIKTLRPTEEIGISVVPTAEGTSRLWFIDTDDRHFVYSCVPTWVITDGSKIWSSGNNEERG